jgi:hypothetical protein
MRFLALASPLLLLPLHPAPLCGQEHAGHGARGHSTPPFFTEPARAMRMFRLDVSAADLGSQQRYGGELEIEWAVIPRLSAMVHIPGVYVVTPGFTRESSVGDVALGWKAVVLERENGAGLAAGMHLHFATGNLLLDMGRGHAALAPILLAGAPLGSDGRWMLLGSAGGHIALSTHSSHPGHPPMGRHWGIEGSSALSWAATSRLSPILEGTVSHSRTEGTAWALVPQVHWLIGRCDAGIGARIPLHDRTRDYLLFKAGMVIHIGS